MIFLRKRKEQPSSNDSRYAEKMMQSLLSMAWFVEARDPYTGGHLWRVGRLAWMLADEAGLSRSEVALASLGGFLHDLGKVGVPDEILRKTSALTDEEYEVIKTHPRVGLRMLAGHPLMQLAADAVGKHHERPDGRGYPAGLKGEEIPVIARVVGICDAFDAMTSHRPYRAGMPIENALLIIEREAGAQFDASLANTFVSLGRAGGFESIVGHSDEGIPLQSCPMCGPIVVVRRESKSGEHLYCGNCSSEFELALENGKFGIKPTGSKGSAAALEPEADQALIARAVDRMVTTMPVNELVQIR